MPVCCFSTQRHLIQVPLDPFVPLLNSTSVPRKFLCTFSTHFLVVSHVHYETWMQRGVPCRACEMVGSQFPVASGTLQLCFTGKIHHTPPELWPNLLVFANRNRACFKFYPQYMIHVSEKYVFIFFLFEFYYIEFVFVFM